MRAAARWSIVLAIGGLYGVGESYKDPGVKRGEQEKLILPLPIPDDAVHLALSDVLSLPEHDRCYMRYVWNQRIFGDKVGDRRSARTTSYAVNTVSQASAISKPWPIAHGELVRIDLRIYAPQQKDRDRWTKFWEELRFDPAFSRLITKDAVDFEERRVNVGRERYVHHPGGDFTYPADCVYGGQVVRALAAGEYRVETLKDQYRTERVRKVKAVARYNSEAIDPLAMAQLQYETDSEAPVVEHRYLKWRLLNSIKSGLRVSVSSKLYETVFGGLYYDFEGIRKAEKGTDLELFFADLGINLKEALFNRLRSDRRIALTRSGVTGHPRDIEVFSVPSAPAGNVGGAITGDVAVQDVDIGDRAYANLLSPRRQAREGIFPKPNGLLRYVLVNGQEELQDRVPADIATDTVVPDPHSKELEPAISCILCHSLKGRDGWHGAQNQVLLLIKRRLDVFDDVTGRGGRQDTLDRLAGLYRGELTWFYIRARNDLHRATLEATGPWTESKLGQTDTCKLLAERLYQERDDWWWTAVDAKRALWELGLDCPAEDADALFNMLVPADARAEFRGVYLEDPRIGAVTATLSINRSDFALARDFLAERVQRHPVYRKLRRMQ